MAATDGHVRAQHPWRLTVLIDLPADFPSLLVAAQAGDAGAFDALFRHYHPMLVRYLRAQDAAAAEDLAAEVWLALAPRLRAFRGDETDSGVGCSPWPAAG